MKKVEMLINCVRIIRGRIRAVLFKMRGAKIGSKSLFEKEVRIDKPWTVRMGVGVHIEKSVWIKAVADDAKISIGDYVFLGRDVEIDVNKEIAIGYHCLVSPVVSITDHNHNIFKKINS